MSRGMNDDCMITLMADMTEISLARRPVQAIDSVFTPS